MKIKSVILLRLVFMTIEGLYHCKQLFLLIIFNTLYKRLTKTHLLILVSPLPHAQTGRVDSWQRVAERHQQRAQSAHQLRALLRAALAHVVVEHRVEESGMWAGLVKV